MSRSGAWGEGAIARVVAREVARQGPIGFDEVMELALYHPDHGFYAGGGQAGRRGDFLTSPEVGPLFGAVLARALDAWWSELGQPDPFVVIEAGAGRGALAQSVLLASPACAPTLRYLLVERSAALRARQREHLTLAPPALAFGPTVEDASGARRPVRSGEGPVLVSLEELPEIDGPATVIANELLDNLAFRLFERTGTGWAEVCVTLDGGRPIELLVPLTTSHPTEPDRWAPHAEPGQRIPIQHKARQWLNRALAAARPGGRLTVIDYATATTAELTERAQDEWLRTYAGHQRGVHPLERLGQQDVTVEVCVDQLAAESPLLSDRSQAELLRAHGLDQLVDEGRRAWQEGAATGDLAALRARSRITEAEGLTDPTGLGAFRVLEWRA